MIAIRWIQRIMTGRYGSDHLCIAIMLFSVILSIVNRFIGSIIITFALIPIIAICVFRMFSKNITARSRENAVFMRLFSKIRNALKKRKQMLAEKKTHRFFKCPGCKKTLRVPKGKGKIYVTCPQCGERFMRET